MNDRVPMSRDLETRRKQSPLLRNVITQAGENPMWKKEGRSQKSEINKRK
jgi:hypothetical protein